MKKWIVNLLALWAITVIVYAMFGHTLDFEFLDWDDPWLITHNPIIRHPGWDSIRTVLFDFTDATRKMLGKEYLPVRDLSFMASYATFGMNPSGYHAINLNVYIFASFVLFLLLEKLAKHASLAFFATLIFIVHPAHVEAVAWISERKSALSMLFFLAGVLAYFQNLEIRKSHWKYFSMILFTLSVFSKSTAIVFFPALWILTRIHGHRMPRNDSILFSIQTFLHLCLAVSIGSRSGMMKAWMGDSLVTHMLTIPWLGLQYVWLLIAPTEVKTLYETTPVDGADLRLLLSITTILCTAALAWHWRKRHPRVLWTLLLFWILLLPVLQIVPIPNRFSARYLFLPSICLSLSFLWFEQILQGSAKKTFLWFSLAWVMFSIAQAREILPRWRDCKALWEEAATRPDQQAYVLTNLFRCHKNENRLVDAQAVATKLLQQYPDQPRVLTDLGSIHLHLRQYDAAREDFDRAYAFHQNIDEWQTNLAVSFLQEGNLQKAGDLLAKVIQRNPSYAPARQNWSSLERALAKIKRSKEYSQKAKAMVHP